MSDPDTNRLEALGTMAQETDAANPTPEQAQAAAAEQTAADQADQAARDWGMLMFTIGGLASMIAPELRQVYTQDRCLTWGEHANQVAEKYGWNGPSHMPELALLSCTATFAVPTFFLVRAKLVEAKEGKATGLLAKFGLWWRARGARRAAATAQAGQGDGSQ